MSSKSWFRNMPLHLMMLPSMFFLIVFCYIPMFGIIIVFQNFLPGKGIFHSKFVGLENFQYLLAIPDIFQVIWNTVYIAVLKVILGLIVPIVFALLLNEIRNGLTKKAIQSVVYMPHFLSWIILGGILIDILSPTGGFVNQILGLFGIKPIFFLGDVNLFPYTMVFSDVWKEFGFSAVIYLAALTRIDPIIYEAAIIDGANRWKQTLNVTLPGIVPIIVLMAALSLGNVLNAGFDQIFNLYSPAVYHTGDIIDTLVYRMGMVNMQYGLASAVGLFKSVVSFVLIAISYKLAEKFANYRIF